MTENRRRDPRTEILHEAHEIVEPPDSQEPGEEEDPKSIFRAKSQGDRE